MNTALHTFAHRRNIVFFDRPNDFAVDDAMPLENSVPRTVNPASNTAHLCHLSTPFEPEVT